MDTELIDGFVTARQISRTNWMQGIPQLWLIMVEGDIIQVVLQNIFANLNLSVYLFRFDGFGSDGVADAER